MTTDRNTPTEDHEHASREHPAEERVDPGTFAYRLFAHLADMHGDTDADLYLARVIAELFALSPIVRDPISDFLLADLKEEIARREDTRYSRSTIALIEAIEDDWRNRG